MTNPIPPYVQEYLAQQKKAEETAKQTGAKTVNQPMPPYVEEYLKQQSSGVKNTESSKSGKPNEFLPILTYVPTVEPNVPLVVDFDPYMPGGGIPATPTTPQETPPGKSVV